MRILGRPPRRGDRPRRRAHHRSSTTRATCSPTPRRCWPCSRWCRRRPSGAASRCRCRPRRAGRATSSQAGGRRDRRGPSCPTPPLMAVGRRAGRRSSPPASDGGFILPDFLPAFDAVGHVRQGARAAGPPRDAAVEGGRRRCPAYHVVHETVVTPWEQKGTVMRTLMEREQDRELVLVDGVKVHARRRLGAGPARPRGARHPRLGRGRRATATPAASPRSTPAASARWCAESERRTADRRSQTVLLSFAAHERPRGPALLRRTTSGPASRTAGCASASPTTPRTHSATSCSSQVPDVGAAVEAGAIVQRGRVDQVGVRHLRPGRRAPSSRSTPIWPTPRSASTRIPTARAGSA